MFHFQDGEPDNYMPKAGDLVLYSADSSNIHCVDEVTAGERITLTLWFSRNSSFDEDNKLLSLLAQKILDNDPGSCIPLPAPSNMYWFSLDQYPDDQQGYDICFARLFNLGYDISPTQGQGCISKKHKLDISDASTKPLHLAKEDKLYSKKFANLLHALQAVQFYLWKQPLLQQLEVGMEDDSHDTNDVVSLSVEQKEAILKLRSVFLSTMQLDKTVFGYSSTGKNREHHFDWAWFSVAIKLWEEYTLKLHKQLLMHLPFWKDYRSLFSVSSSLVEK